MTASGNKAMGDADEYERCLNDIHMAQRVCGMSKDAWNELPVIEMCTEISAAVAIIIIINIIPFVLCIVLGMIERGKRGRERGDMHKNKILKNDHFWFCLNWM